MHQKQPPAKIAVLVASAAWLTSPARGNNAIISAAASAAVHLVIVKLSRIVRGFKLGKWTAPAHGLSRECEGN